MILIHAPSPNFNDRPQGAGIKYIIVHYTALPDTKTSLEWMCDPLKEVSAHYLICRTGAVYQLVEDQKRAWHAGVSRWGEDLGLNDTSIGIELDNNGFEAFAQGQIDSLLGLLDHLCKAHHIPRANILGHQDIAPERKIDPGPLFPWDVLYEAGFGELRRRGQSLTSGPSKS